MTEVDLVVAAASAQQTGGMEFSDAQGKLRERIDSLRETVLAMIASNETKDELEQLGRQEFVLDLAEKKRLDAVREEALAALRDKT